MNDKRTMPKVMPMPAPSNPRPEAARSNRQSEAVYAEEAMRAYQRHLDQVDEINRLSREMDDWRRRALMAEAEIERLSKREQDLTDAIERQQEKLMNERDTYRNRLNNMISQFHSAGAIILKCLDAANTETGGPQVNLGTLAQEIDRVTEPEGSEKTITTPEEPEEPLPRIVAAGPREP
jgi:chromosome segregation ATPase